MRARLHIPIFVLMSVPAAAALAQAGTSGLAAQAAVARIQTTASKMLAAQYPKDAHRLDVEVIRTRGLDAVGSDMRLSFPEADALPRAHTLVDVLAPDTSTGWAKTGWALLYVAHYDSIAVLQAPLQKDEALPPDAVEAAWMETTTHGDGLLRIDAFRAMADSGTVFARRLLRSGRALRTNDLRPPYAAQLGESVILTYQRGNIHLKMTCEARAPGFVGDVIRLYAPQTGTNYRARLTAPGTAEWLETL
jgi:flagella basal body P-ring formation protein FlgA